MDYMFFVIISLILLFLAIKNRQAIKDTYLQLNAKQIISIILSYIIALIVVFLLLYYGGNYIVSFITIPTLHFIVKIVIIFFVLSTCLAILNKVVSKISKGIL